MANINYKKMIPEGYRKVFIIEAPPSYRFDNNSIINIFIDIFYYIIFLKVFILSLPFVFPMICYYELYCFFKNYIENLDKKE